MASTTASAPRWPGWSPRIAYTALFRRFPDLRLARPGEDVPFSVDSAVHGLASLPVSW